ncbi:hypothetical protein BKA69DRAFT_1041003 [Paraphysoderma sedebokerense]|nr:hypothetical protein BKA69DRAFT_1041003 [Paraphysoderma sedebokerense]
MATTSQGFKSTLRYGALGLGVVYGFVHNMSLSKSAAADREHSEKLHKLELFEKARKEYALKKAKETKMSTGDLITDPDSPAFDLEKVIEYYVTKAESSEKH